MTDANASHGPDHRGVASVQSGLPPAEVDQARLYEIRLHAVDVKAVQPKAAHRVEISNSQARQAISMTKQPSALV